LGLICRWLSRRNKVTTAICNMHFSPPDRHGSKPTKKIGQTCTTKMKMWEGVRAKSLNSLPCHQRAWQGVIRCLL
jgi:hypothetical protein